MRIALAFLLFVALAAQGAPAERGRLLYRQGAPERPACIGCHGRHGEGRREGGIAAPPLRQALEAAVNGGRDGTGRELHRLMPRYRFTPSELAGLNAYLATLGTDADADPGIGPRTIQIGAPGAGGDARAALQRVFDSVNQGGGIYGRKLDLVAEPAPAEAVFAFVGDGAPEAPSIGAVAQAGAWSFGLAPGWDEQGRVLVDQAAAGAHGTLALVYGPDAPAAALQAMRAQAALHGLTLADYPYRDAPPALAGEKGVLFAGSQDQLRALAAALDRETLLYTFALRAGGAVFQLAPGAAQRLRMVVPAHWPPERSIASASAAILVEALKRSGRKLDRQRLVESLQGMRDVRIDGVPPVTFGPNRRFAAAGVVMVEVDAVKTSYVPYTGVLEARTAP